MTSHLTSMDTISLSHTVFEIFDFEFCSVWPWYLTPKGHLEWKSFSPFESPYMTSYLTSTNTISLSPTVFEILDFEIFRVWPWPLTPKGHRGSKILIPFESPFMTFYMTPMDTISLSRTVFEIFDFEVFRVWPWPLTPKGHLRLKYSILFESPYMTSYLTSMDTISLSMEFTPSWYPKLVFSTNIPFQAQNTPFQNCVPSLGSFPSPWTVYPDFDSCYSHFMPYRMKPSVRHRAIEVHYYYYYYYLVPFWR